MRTSHKRTHRPLARPLAMLAMLALLGALGWNLPRLSTSALAYSAKTAQAVKTALTRNDAVEKKARSVAAAPAPAAAVQQGQGRVTNPTYNEDYNQLVALYGQMRTLKANMEKASPGPTQEQQNQYAQLSAQIKTLSAKLGLDGYVIGSGNTSAAAEPKGITTRYHGADGRTTIKLAPNATQLINGALAAGDGTFNRPLSFSQGGTCTPSATGTAVFRDVYEFQVGQNTSVTASLCAADGGAATHDSYLVMYQAAGGAQLPSFAPTACGNALAASDDVCGDDAKLSGINVVAGYFYVVVTSFGNGATGTYTLFVDNGITGGGGGNCTDGQKLVDPGFETTSASTFVNPSWPSTSTNFGTSFCSVAGCGNAGGAAVPRGGTFWAWFGGTTAAEVGSVEQAVVIPTAGNVNLNYYLRIGTVTSPFNATLVVKVDGTTVQTITEPSTAEAAYTLRTVNLAAYANGASHTIRFEYTNPASSGTSNFSVDDVTLDVVCQVTACTLTCPANVTVSNAANQCGANVTYPAPTTSGTCNNVSCNPTSGSFFPKGTTTVTCTATGTNGTQTCSFSVTVNDTQPPAITCPSNVFVGTTGNSTVVNYAAPTASDNCPGVTTTCVPASGSSFPVGVTTVTCTAKDAVNNTASCSFAVTVNKLTVAALTDPLACTGPGNTINGSFTVSNNGNVTQTVAATVALGPNAPLQGLLALTCSVSGPGTCAIAGDQASLSYSASLNAGQTATISYVLQVNDGVPTGTVLTSAVSASFNGGPAVTAGASITANCQAVGPGLPFPTRSEMSDQKAGSVLIYPVYTSSATNSNTQNSRIDITNTHQNLPALLHLFFVADSCSVSDAYICLTANQTSSFLTSDLDPGTTGYLVVVAVNRTGCPVNFNYLIGDEYVKFSSGHAANLGAEAIAAIAGSPFFASCDNNSILAQLNFDGSSYNRLPTTVAIDSIGSRADGNDTMLIVDRVAGDLRTGPAALGNLFGVTYDDAENSISWTINSSSCQFRTIINNTVPRTTPRFEQFIGAGRTGWMRFFHRDGGAIIGSVINFNANAAASAGAFNQGHNLHTLTLTNTGFYIIPVFPPTC